MKPSDLPTEVSESLARLMRDSDFAIRYLEDMMVVWCWMRGQNVKRAERDVMDTQIKNAAQLRSLFKSLTARWLKGDEKGPHA